MRTFGCVRKHISVIGNIVYEFVNVFVIKVIFL